MPGTSTAVPGGANERDLWRRLKKERDQRAREELVRLYMPLARRMAGRYAGVSSPTTTSPGRQPRPAERDRPLRLDQRHALRRLRQADDPRRTETVLPRQGLDDPRAALDPRPDGRSRTGDREADPGAAPAALGPKRSPIKSEIDCDDVLEALEARDNRRPLSLDRRRTARTPTKAPAPSGSVRPDGNYELVEDRLAMESVLPASTSASARCCDCASSRNCRRPRSPRGSAARRCTSRGSCAHALDRLREEATAAGPAEAEAA